MLGKHQQLVDCKVHRLVQGGRCFISCTSCYRLGLFFLSLSFLPLSLFSSLERRRRKFPDMLLISSHTVDQMVKNARAAAQFMDCVAGEGVFLRNDFQLDHLFLKSKHESMNKVVPDKLQKVPARKCFKTQCIWRTSPAHPALPHLKGTNSREVILHILILFVDKELGIVVPLAFYSISFMCADMTSFKSFFNFFFVFKKCRKQTII